MKPIRVGVVGTGWGQLQIEAFRRVKDTQVTALCDSDQDKLQQVAKQYQIPHAFSDYASLVASDVVDWIAIAAPPAEHARMVRSAIESGKHFFCEKPVALELGEARDLQRAADERGVVHAIDYEMRYLPAHAYCKELIEEEYLGTLFRVDVTMTIASPWGEHGNWAVEDDQGGGVLMELGSHFIDTLLWLFGDVSRVVAGRRTYYPTVRVPGKKEMGNGGSIRKAVTGDDAFWCVLQFARGGEAIVNFVTGARHDPGWSISAYGQSGTLLIRSGQLSGMREGDREVALIPIPKRLELGKNPDDPLMWGMAKLIERAAARIQGVPEALPYPDISDDVAVGRVISAIRRASDERRWATVE